MAQQRAITQEDLDANPILTQLGGTLGDTVSIYQSDQPNTSEQTEESAG